MELVRIGGHTFDQSLVKDGCIIDVGCRGFEFSNHFKNNIVYAIDPDPQVFKHMPDNPMIIKVCSAISDKCGDTTFYRNGERSVLTDIYQPYAHQYTPCICTTMDYFYSLIIADVDVLKLDCEGAEYIILGDGFNPIPKQITVEFHKHTVPEYHEKHYEKCMKNLLEYYDLVYEHETLMDSLFIRK